jgi:energy-coupling factor transporter ATP-binding protein EcfA2
MFEAIAVENLGGFSSLQWSGHQSINILIGENDTGKTYLLKLLYCLARSLEDFTRRSQSDRPPWREVLADKLFWVYQPGQRGLGELVQKGESRLRVEATLHQQPYHFAFGRDTTRRITDATDVVSLPPELNALFLPPKEVLTALDAIAATREQLQIFGFDDTYQDLITALRLPPTQADLPEALERVLQSLQDLLTGEIVREGNEFIFRRGREKYLMAQTAEGIKKIGILTTLIRNRTLRPHTILCIDEPETNLHPYAIVALVKMLFDLGQSGVQIYLASHSYFVIKQFALLAQHHQTPIQLCSLLKHDKTIHLELSDLRDGLPDNPIIDASIRLYEETVALDLLE